MSTGSSAALSFQQASQKLLGGIPTHPDIAPSAVFTAAYALVIPLAIWRVASRASRNTVLIRPCIFTVIRVATWILRAVEGAGHYSLGIIIAETIFLTAGTVLIVEPLVALVTGLLEASIPYAGPANYDRRGRLRRRDEVGLVGRLLRLALLAVIVMAIISSSNTSSAFSNPTGSTAHTVNILREVSAIILVAASGGTLLALGYFFVRFGLPARPTGFAALVAALLAVLCSYRVASAFRASGVNTRAAFYLALVLPEFLVTVLYFSVNLNTLFPAATKNAGSTSENAVPMQNTNYGGEHGYAVPAGAPPTGPPRGYRA